MRILVLNAGSSNLKASVIEPPDRPRSFDRTVDWVASDATDATDASGAADTADRVSATVRTVVEAAGGPIDGVGHRVVHGGSRFTGPVGLDDEVIAAIESLDDLAPLHNPLAVATMRASRRLLPDVPQIAGFDTAFHATLPEAARRYPVPDAWDRAGIRRYGFHGLSVAWSTRRAAELLGRPVEDLCLVVAHLGGGCSVTAVEGGRSVDTSMGMTPLEGLMMGTRAGSIDPGIIFRLLRDGHPAADIEADLDHRSGLVAIGGTADMARLLELEAAGEPGATLALEMFVRRAAAGIAASTTSLPRLDAIVFTGGIGEHAPTIRTRIGERLRIGNPAGPERVSAGDGVQGTTSGPAIVRITAREDVVIADQVVARVTDAPSPTTPPASGAAAAHSGAVLPRAGRRRTSGLPLRRADRAEWP